jgi:amino acid permease
LKQKAYIRPGKVGSVMGIIAGTAMLIFGLFFLTLLQDESSQTGRIFMLLWIFIVLCIIGYSIYNLVTTKASLAATEEIELESGDAADQASGNFEEKLRSLERLKKDGLLSEEEYTQKRKEIMQQKW